MTDQPAPLPLAADDCPTYVVVGGDHVTILLDRVQSGDLLDVIDVRSGPGEGQPAHRHAFAEWVRVLEGELTLCEEHDATIRPTNTLAAGDSVFLAPWGYHATMNLAQTACRFQVVGQPAMMSGYFAQAGVRVTDATMVAERAPLDADQLSEIARRWGIQFWNGPTDPARRPNLTTTAAATGSPSHPPGPDAAECFPDEPDRAAQAAISGRLGRDEPALITSRSCYATPTATALQTTSQERNQRSPSASWPPSLSPTTI